ncbi:MAG: glycosyltransferase family 2 protein [Candidatus Levyibacteriota bacterium]|jgi:glycosyltransferase involved in cell wall biosynthesis
MISAVVPAFNEEESLNELYKVLSVNLLKLGQEYEIIFVDDGSTDSTLQILQKLASKDKTIRIFSFRKNRGKAEALTVGFQMAKGDYIVTLDADLQDRPEEIKKLLDKAKEGFDLVSGWRKDRKDALRTRLSSQFFNFIMSSFWGVHLHDYNCGLKLYTKEAARSLNLYGGMYRFIPLLVAEKGFEVTEIPVVHEKRKFGKSKYGFSKIFRDVPDMFTILFLSKYAKRPLHFFGFVGGIISAIGFFIMIYLTILHFMGQRIGNRPLLTFGMLLMLAGLQLLFTGLLADLILHISQKDSQGINLNEGFKYKTK